MAMVMKKIKEFFFGKDEIRTTPKQLREKLARIEEMINSSANIEEVKVEVDAFVAELDALDAQVADNIKDLTGRTGWLTRDAVNDDLARLQKGKAVLKDIREKLAKTVKPLGIEVKLPNPNENQSEVEFGS